MESGDLEAAHDAGESQRYIDRAVVINIYWTILLNKEGHKKRRSIKRKRKRGGKRERERETVRKRKPKSEASNLF